MGFHFSHYFFLPIHFHRSRPAFIRVNSFAYCSLPLETPLSSGLPPRLQESCGNQGNPLLRYDLPLQCDDIFTLFLA
jgi:hypothetical protein